jgi:RHS repeat-associated protein
MVRHLARTARLLLLLAGGSAHAQAPGNSADYTRTQAFTYYADGTLQTSTVEPGSPASCSVTTHVYDAYGNVAGSTVANCAGASGRALFAARTASAVFGGTQSQAITVRGTSVNVVVPAGLVATTLQNPLGQTETRQYDPRFGVATTRTDIANVTSSVVVDDFGRTVSEVHPDGTSVASFHCVLAPSGLDTSSNSAGCATPPVGEAPPLAIRFIQQEAHDKNGAKAGPYARTYFDALDRKIRIATESFDGAAQPAGRSAAVIVSDIVYDANGMQVLTSQPYFLSSGSSSTAGANDVGVTATAFDELGRVASTYAADPNADASHAHTFGGSGPVGYGVYGSQRASVTTHTYTGLAATIVNDIGQQRTEERSVRGDILRVTDTTGAQVAFLADAFGNVVKTTDALQNSVVVTYDILGRKIQMVDPDKGAILYCIDPLGQVKFEQTANMRGGGTVPSCNDAVASGKTVPDASLTTGWTAMAYDQLGRLAQRREPEYLSTWSFDAYADNSSCTAGAGKLCEVTTSQGSDKKIFYDAFGREISNRTDVTSGPSFASAVSFDATTGRLATKTYPTGLQIAFGYTSRGALQSVSLNTSATVQPLPDAQGGTAPGTTLAAGSVLWQAQAVDAKGNLEKDVVGNGISDRVSYEAATGRILSVVAGTGSNAEVLNHQYTWDSVNNLKSRTDGNGDGGSGAVTEAFGFDGLNRLTRYDVSATEIPNLSRTVTLQYNALGMLLYKSDLGNYRYGASGSSSTHPHALLGLTGVQNSTFTPDFNGNVIGATGNSKYAGMTYTSFDNVATATGQGGLAYSWTYDDNHARIKEVRTSGGNTRTIWYLHPDNVGGLGFESEIDSSPASQSNRHFIVEAGKTIGVLISTGSLPTLAAGQSAPTLLGSITLNKVEYWHKDHLGSLSATTDHLGLVTARYSYDPFGKRRFTDGNADPLRQIVVDWNPTLNSGSARGFTGQEEMDDIGLVNLNGRIYDSYLGRFIQVDPVVSDTANLQAYDRYAYVNDNPLNATDPSGFIPDELTRAEMTARWNSSVLGLPSNVAPTIIGWVLTTTTVAGDSSGLASNSGGSAATDQSGESRDDKQQPAGPPQRVVVVSSRDPEKRRQLEAKDGEPLVGLDKQEQRTGCGQCNRLPNNFFPEPPAPQEGVTSICPECYLIGSGGIVRGLLAKLGLGAAEDAAGMGALEGVWNLKPFARGVEIEKALGQNLPANFPVIDRFANGVATSIKSLDLQAASYQSASVLSRTVSGYVDQVAAFQGRTWAGVTVRGGDITGRALDLAVPQFGTAAQRAVLNQAVQYGASRGVAVNIITISK